MFASYKSIKYGLSVSKYCLGCLHLDFFSQNIGFGFCFLDLDWDVAIYSVFNADGQNSNLFEIFENLQLCMSFSNRLQGKAVSAFCIFIFICTCNCVYLYLYFMFPLLSIVQASGKAWILRIVFAERLRFLAAADF